MSNKFEFRNDLVISEKAKKNDENAYIVSFDNLIIYPIDEIINIFNNDKSQKIGTCKITSLLWNKGKTHIVYELLSLNGVN